MKWTYFFIAIVVNVGLIVLGTWLSKSPWTLTFPFFSVLFSVIFIAQNRNEPNRQQLGRYFMWGTLASVPVLLAIALYLVSGIEC